MTGYPFAANTKQRLRITEKIMQRAMRTGIPPKL
jgi:hypothetical protein